MAMKGYSIFFARIIYAISWFYLAPAIPYIIFTFKVPSNLAGLIPFSFFLGSGIMQIPSAFISSKLGSRNTLVLGLFIMSLSAFLIGFSRVFYQILVF
ncbi:MAG: MFS transporter, partial [Acidianus infernus]|nr:MFS transporter [Acidianus infernus]